MNHRPLFFVLAIILLSGCLKTRAQLREDNEDQAPQRQTVALQKAESKATAAPATSASRFEEYDEQLRQMNGRIETLENSASQNSNSQLQSTQSQAKEKMLLEQRFQNYEEALKKLEAQIAGLNEEVARLKAPPPPPVAAAPVKGRSAFEEGEELFGAKKWKEAIVAFQKYRDGNPKGKSYADATYKIGLSFQELGLKDEARAFFEEVTSKFPSSKEAKKAAVRLKSLK